MKLLSEVELERSEPSFLLQNPGFYQTTKENEAVVFQFGNALKKDGGGKSPGFMARLGAMLTSAKSVRIEVGPGRCVVETPETKTELNPLREALLHVRSVTRTGRAVGGMEDRELFLSAQDAHGQTLFFPLAKDGVADRLGAEIAQAAGCLMKKVTIDKIAPVKA